MVKEIEQRCLGITSQVDQVVENEIPIPQPQVLNLLLMHQSNEKQYLKLLNIFKVLSKLI